MATFIHAVFVGCQFYGVVKKGTNNLRSSKKNKVEWGNLHGEHRLGGIQRKICSWPKGGSQKDFLE